MKTNFKFEASAPANKPAKIQELKASQFHLTNEWQLAVETDDLSMINEIERDLKAHGLEVITKKNEMIAYFWTRQTNIQEVKPANSIGSYRLTEEQIQFIEKNWNDRAVLFTIFKGLMGQFYNVKTSAASYICEKLLKRAKIDHYQVSEIMGSFAKFCHLHGDDFAVISETQLSCGGAK